VSALYPQHAATGKSFIVETFFGFRAKEGFLLLGREKRRPPREGYGTRRLPTGHSSLRGECPVGSSLYYAKFSMVRQRAYPRSFGFPVSLVTTGQQLIRSIKQPSTLRLCYLLGIDKVYPKASTWYGVDL